MQHGPIAIVDEHTDRCHRREGWSLWLGYRLRDADGSALTASASL